MSQAIDVLVNRGYLERSPDADDRRRVTLQLTERGRQAVEAVARGVDAVDLQLLAQVPCDEVEAMRAGLLALARIKADGVATGAGRPRQARQLRHFSPIFPVRDMAVALAHYSALGFNSFAYDDGNTYGFANREGIGLQLAADPEHDPDRGASTYLVRVRRRMRSTQSGAGPVSAVAPGLSARRPTRSARDRTPTRMGT